MTKGQITPKLIEDIVSVAKALKLRKELQAQIAHLIENNSQTIPIILGDMNATLYDDDRSSCLRYVQTVCC